MRKYIRVLLTPQDERLLTMIAHSNHISKSKQAVRFVAQYGLQCRDQKKLLSSLFNADDYTGLSVEVDSHIYNVVWDMLPLYVPMTSMSRLSSTYVAMGIARYRKTLHQPRQQTLEDLT